MGNGNHTIDQGIHGLESRQVFFLVTSFTFPILIKHVKRQGHIEQGLIPDHVGSSPPDLFLGAAGAATVPLSLPFFICGTEYASCWRQLRVGKRKKSVRAQNS
jgi:hypothetical protein